MSDIEKWQPTNSEPQYLVARRPRRSGLEYSVPPVILDSERAGFADAQRGIVELESEEVEVEHRGPRLADLQAKMIEALDVWAGIVSVESTEIELPTGAEGEN